jgi:putative tryptophan/tyrosine transport system substrate-binding protein
MLDVRRREFITLLGAGAAWPIAARAQQPAMPVIGFLRPSTAAGSEHLLAAFRRGLSELSYVEEQNVAIEYRWAEGREERLPALAADLVRRQVAVVVAAASNAAIAAKDATSSIPIVFVTAIDPVEAKLVESLNRPGGNATGITYLTSALAAKRIELIHELVPAAKSVAVLVHPTNRTTEPFMHDLRAGAEVLGLQVVVSNVASERDLEGAFATLAQQRPGALIVGPDPSFTARAAQITALAARHALPAIYTLREFALAGGLMSWGTSLTEQYRLAGTYVGKILKGAKPADLPVVQPTKYELVLNLKAAKALGLDVPPMLLARADEVIE